MQSSRKRERHDHFSLSLYDIPECWLSDVDAKPKVSTGGVSLFGDAKRTKQDGFLARYSVDHTPAHATCVASNNSLRFSSGVSMFSSCHSDQSPSSTHVVANGMPEATYDESKQRMFPAFAPGNHANPSNFASAADACAIVLEKVRLDPTEASYFQKDHTHATSCKPSDLSRGSIATEPGWLSSSETSPSYSP